MQEPEAEVYGPPTELEYLRKERERLQAEVATLRAAAKPKKLDLVDHMRLLADGSASGTRYVLLLGAAEIERLRRFEVIEN
jgi:hypothetical protein